MTERIITDSNGRKHITNEPQLHPPQRTWVGLTDEEIWSAVDRIGASDSDVNPYQILNNARAIEAKLRSKNNV